MGASKEDCFCEALFLHCLTSILLYTSNNMDPQEFPLYIIQGALSEILSDILEPDVVVKRQEALAAARLKMQEELNAQVEKHKEKLRQLEEEKRRRKIEMWDSMQEGKSYKRNARGPQEEDSPGPSTSSVIPKRKSDRKPLRGGVHVNPEGGEGKGTRTLRVGPVSRPKTLFSIGGEGVSVGRRCRGMEA
uniref:Selenoprotein S n=2 Tax=Equus TaxID=9789 RepID=A0A9L0TKE2_HORSE